MFDSIVIGSGLGGLVSATILAKEGKKVLVIEKNNQLGGNLQCFVRNKKIFDTGVHYIGGLDSGQNLHTYFNYLGIIQDLKLERMDLNAFDQIQFGDDPESYPFAQSKENYIQQLAKYFPEETKALHAFVNRMEDCCHRFPLFLVDGQAEYTVHTDDIERSVFDVIKEYIKDTKLQAVLLGSQMLYAGDPHKTPFYVHALSVFSYIQSAWKCTLGGSQIAKLLAHQILRHGGQIIKYEEVVHIHTNAEGYAESVETKSGKTFFAKHFISNIHPKQTLEKIKGFNIRKNYRKRILESQETISSFSIFLTLKPKKIPYKSQNIYFSDNSTEINNLNYTDNQTNWPKNYMLSMMRSKTDPNWAETITVFTYMDFKEVDNWTNSKNTVAEKAIRPAAYLDFKERKAKQFIAKIEELMPEIQGNIQAYHTASPLSYRDYIGNQRGDLYGFVKDIQKPFHNFNSAQTKIRNLFQTGQHQNMHGILGVTISAVMTCSEILGKQFLLNKISAFRENSLEDEA